MVATANTISEKLASALPYHYKEMRPFREARRELLKDYAGRTTYPAYVEKGEEKEKQIENLTMQAAEAFTLGMAANCPRFLCDSSEADAEWFAAKMQRALDRYAQEMYLEEILQEIVRDSFFSVGVAKVYQSASAAVAAEVDYRMDHGRPWLARVGYDRLVYDTHANSPEECSFIGDYYSMSFKKATQSGRFTELVRWQIKELGTEGYSEDDDKGEDLSRSDNDQPLEEMVHFCDVFVRSAKAVLTYLVDRNLNLRLPEPVQSVPWVGEECGPYYFLSMGPVPDHFMPSSPGQNLKLLQQFVNTLNRKLEEQARLQKQVGTADKGSGDAQLAMGAKNGEWREFQNPKSIGVISLNGPDQNLFGMKVHYAEKYSQHASNLYQKLGLAQSADTASQERMIGAMVSRVEAFYQQRYVAFVRKCARGLARLIFHDEKLRIPGVEKIHGMNKPVVLEDHLEPYGTDGARLGTYDLYRVDIDPYSMAYQSPGEKAAFLDAQVAKWAPAMPALAQLGKTIDLGVFFEEMADLTHTPVLRRIFKDNQPPTPPDAAAGGPMPMGGANVYEHVSRGSGSGRGPDSEAMQYMQAAAPQQEVAA